MTITNFSYKTRVSRLIITIYAALVGLGLMIFVLFVSEKLHYPLWLKSILAITALLLLYEGLIVLIKPISLSHVNGIFNVGYLLSSCKFTKSEIFGYSTFRYATRDGFRNAVVLYFNERRTLELNEILIDGDIIGIFQTLLVDLPHYPLRNNIFWLGRFPVSHSREML